MPRPQNRLDYPRLRWPASGWWFTAVGTLISVALVLFPGVTGLTGRNRLVLILLLISVPGAIVLSLHVTTRARVFVRRALRYGAFQDAIESLEGQLGAAERSLSSILEERKRRNAFGVAYCYGFENRTFIALRKKKGPAVTPGAEVAVVEQGSKSLLGKFKVLKDDGSYYVCELDGFMDALWLGHVKQSGAQRSEAPPEAVAWVLPETNGESNE